MPGEEARLESRVWEANSQTVLAPTLSLGPWLALMLFLYATKRISTQILGPLCRMRQVQTSMAAVAAAPTLLFWGGGGGFKTEFLGVIALAVLELTL